MPNFIWLICLPLFATPLVYLAGRVETHTAAGRRIAPALRGQARWAALITLLAVWIVFAATVRDFSIAGPHRITIGAVALAVDGVTLLLAALALTLATCVAVFSGSFLAGDPHEEKYYAMLVAMTGAIIGLGCATDLFNLWVWFETMAITSYMLVAFHRDDVRSLEALAKYLVQSVIGSLLVLFGIALVLAHTATLDLATIARTADNSPLLLVAGALFIAGFGVKVALVPMHTWLPDAHAQAPSGISAMLSGVVIEAGLIALLRALTTLFAVSAAWGPILLGFAALNMLYGNLMALRQTQVKRLLAFSSLAHIGYILLGVGFAAVDRSAAGIQGAFFHLLTHGLMKGLAFLCAGAFLHLLHHQPGLDANRTLEIDDLAGAGRKYPLTAFAFSIALLSLAGMPPLAGFMSKWSILVAGFNSGNPWLLALVGFAAFNSVLSLAYYAPIINRLYRKHTAPMIRTGTRFPRHVRALFASMTAAILLVGLWPALLTWLAAPAGRTLAAAFGLLVAGQ